MSPWVQLSLKGIIHVADAMAFEFLGTNSQCGDIAIPGHPARGKEAVYNFNSSP